MYLVNKDGFTLLAMGFTGKKALEFKLAFIKAFIATISFYKKHADRIPYIHIKDCDLAVKKKVDEEK